MTLKDVMDPIQYFEYVSNRGKEKLNPEESSSIEKVQPREPDYKKMLDSIQYFEHMSKKEGI